MRRKNKTAFKQRYMRATRQKLISNNEDKAFSVLHRSTRKSLKQIYLPSFLESNNMSLGHWSPRCTAVDKSFRAGLTYAQRISPVKRREGEKEERKMTKLKEEREEVCAFTFSFDEANCAAWKPGRREHRRESESTIDKLTVIVMQLLFKWSRGSRSIAAFHSGTIDQGAAPVEPILSKPG